MGNDTIYTRGGYFDSSNVFGEDGDDHIILTGNGYAEDLRGGAGNDTFDMTAGDGSAFGEAGDDLYLVDFVDDVYDFDDDVVEAAGEGIDQVNASATWTLGADVENLLLTGTAAIDGTGNATANKVTGNAANNTVSGEGGDDSVNGASGNDTVLGGAGNDTLQGEAGNDTLRGDAGADRLSVGTGVDALYGGDGDDVGVINGVERGDVADGGAGTDTLWVYGGAGNDTMRASGTGVTVNGVAVGTAWEKLQLYGYDGNDALTGGAAGEFIYGGNGADTLDGGAGTDVLEGGAGDDAYVLAAAGDRVVEAAGGGTDTVSSAATLTLAAEVENLVLTGTAAIGGTGNGGANRLTGNAAANALSGGAGSDFLTGGAGKDALTGGTGDDAFCFGRATEGGDTIADFRNAAGNNDAFRVSASGFGSGLSVGTLSASRFQSRADNLARDADDRFILRTTDKTLWFDGNGNGSGGLTMLADLDAAATVTSADILLV